VFFLRRSGPANESACAECQCFRAFIIHAWGVKVSRPSLHRRHSALPTCAKEAAGDELVPAVHLGIGLTISHPASARAYSVRQRGVTNQALWEGEGCGDYAAAHVGFASLTVPMWRTARRIKGDIEGHLRVYGASSAAAPRSLGRLIAFTSADDLAGRHGVTALPDGYAAVPRSRRSTVHSAAQRQRPPLCAPSCAWSVVHGTRPPRHHGARSSRSPRSSCW
jgi:hypothetical protein